MCQFGCHCLFSHKSATWYILNEYEDLHIMVDLLDTFFEGVIALFTWNISTIPTF